MVLSSLSVVRVAPPSTTMSVSPESWMRICSSFVSETFMASSNSTTRTTESAPLVSVAFTMSGLVVSGTIRMLLLCVTLFGMLLWFDMALGSKTRLSGRLLTAHTRCISFRDMVIVVPVLASTDGAPKSVWCISAEVLLSMYFDVSMVSESTGSENTTTSRGLSLSRYRSGPVEPSVGGFSFAMMMIMVTVAAFPARSVAVTDTTLRDPGVANDVVIVSPDPRLVPSCVHSMVGSFVILSDTSATRSISSSIP